MFNKNKIRTNICNSLMGLGIVASLAWLDYPSIIFFGEAELPLDLREKK